MDKLFEVLADLLGLDSVEFIAALKDGDKFLEGDKLTDKVRDIVQGRIKSAKDEQHKRGKREQDEAVARWIKSQGFANPDGLKGQALIEAFADWKTAQAAEGDEDGKKKPAEMSEEELAKLPAVKTLLGKRLQAADAKFTDLTKQFDDFKMKAQRQSVEAVGQRRAAEILEAKGAILEVAGAGITKEQRLKAFFRLLDWGKMGLNEKGDDVVLLNDDGEPLKDDFGKAVTFESLVIGEAKPIFGFQKIDPTKRSPSPGQKPGDKGGERQRMSFDSDAAFDDYIASEPDPEKRLQAQEDRLAELTEKVE